MLWFAEWGLNGCDEVHKSAWDMACYIMVKSLGCFGHIKVVMICYNIMERHKTQRYVMRIDDRLATDLKECLFP